MERLDDDDDEFCIFEAKEMKYYFSFSRLIDFLKFQKINNKKKHHDHQTKKLL